MTSIHNRTPQSHSVKHYFQFFFLTLAMGLFSTQAMAEKINLNQADALTLQYIPGIGPVKSAEIIQLRSASGGFTQFDELLAVKGIGKKTLEVIRQYASLDNGVTKLTQEMIDNPPKANNP